MRTTRRYLRRLIQEEIGYHTKQLQQYETKGEWRLRQSGAGETYLKPGWMAGKEVEDFFGDYDEAKIFDNELEAIVNRDRISDDPANIGAGKLEVEGAPAEG